MAVGVGWGVGSARALVQRTLDGLLLERDGGGRLPVLAEGLADPHLVGVRVRVRVRVALP